MYLSRALFVILTAQAAALIATPSTTAALDNALAIPTHEVVEETFVIQTQTLAAPSITTIPKFVPSPLITIAPLSRNPLELRQKCFDDRGFSVDCATWTGYYYTWGGEGHPYAGGPGDDGSGSGYSGSGGNSNGAGSIFIGAASKLRMVLTYVSICLALSLVIMLL